MRIAQIATATLAALLTFSALHTAFGNRWHHRHRYDCCEEHARHHHRWQHDREAARAAGYTDTTGRQQAK